MSEPGRAAGRAAKSAKPAKPAKPARPGRTDGSARPATVADPAKPAPAATAGESGGDWRAQADRIAAHARDFLDALAALGRGEGGDEIVPLLLLEVAQVMLAGAQLGASTDVIPPGNAEPDVGADPDTDVLRVGLAARLAACDEYAELFDPYRDDKPTAFRLSDDLAAMAADLIHGMRHY